MTLTAQPVTTTTELTGRITATAVADVRPQVDGIIRARLFTEGTTVRAAQPLYQIDPRLYLATRHQTAAQLASAQASAATALAKVLRYNRLQTADAVARQDVDDAVAADCEAKASLRTASPRPCKLAYSVPHTECRRQHQIDQFGAKRIVESRARNQRERRDRGARTQIEQRIERGRRVRQRRHRTDHRTQR